MRNHYLKLAFVVLALGLSECGNQKNKSQNITIAAIPSSPIVFTSDINTTQGGQPLTVTHPWFKFGVNINNSSDTTITVIGLEVTVTAIDDSGQVSTKVTTFDPSAYNYTTITLACVYSDFGSFTPGGASAPDPLMPTTCPSNGQWTNVLGQVQKCVANSTLVPILNNTQFYMIPSAPGCATISPTFYVGSNDSGPNHDNFRYTVKVKPLGWFGDRSNPTDRFENFVDISTQ